MDGRAGFGSNCVRDLSLSLEVRPTPPVERTTGSPTSAGQARRRKPWLGSNRLGASWLALWLAVAGGLAGFGLPLSGPSPTPPGKPTGRTAVGSTLRAIETLRVGDRVWTDQPNAEVGDTAIDARTWRRLTLRAPARGEDGTEDVVEVETLQPPCWVITHGARVGAWVPLPLDLVEMGLPEELRAEVVADDPCPPLRAGPGRVVLTTVRHRNRDVRELTVEDGQGRRETLRPTGLHRFCREPDGDWAAAQDLRDGDVLRGRFGALRVVANRSVPGVQTVYNLTVEGEHTYYVSSLGALAHNNGCSQPPPRPGSTACPPSAPARPSLPTFTPGGKTSGVLRTPTGDVPLQSGWQGPASSIPRGTSGFDIVTRTHVEGHAAAVMRQQGLTEATVHINNPQICTSCSKLLPRMLPPGSRLTVVLPDGTSVTFTGVAP